MLEASWLIPVLPFAASVVLFFFGRRFGSVGGPLVGIAATTVAFLLAIGSLLALRAGADPMHVQVPWLYIQDLFIKMGLRMGNLEAFLLVMVTFASLFIQVYSIGYMQGDEKYNRFFTVVTLFTAGMLTVVMADNLLLFLLGWEIMGFASYSLIGHWFESPANSWAAFKAFVTTRIGDLGLLAAMFLLVFQTGSLQFDEIFAAVQASPQGAWWITLAALFLLWAAIGKSAQVPLHVWLPDAMAGPTPVSALIHAATMVAAGVFLVARSYPLFEASGTALEVVAWVGGITAMFGAIIAVLQVDIKRILAFSTMSQLGYMMMGLGVGGFAAGLFHLVTHGFFKALLFLGAGSVIHALHEEQDIRKMGGLMGKLPITSLTFLIGALALAGIWPFAGFYSKDEVLLAAYGNHPVLFWLGVAAAALTAFYMTRLVIVAFMGPPQDRKLYEQAHESPAVMTVPLLALAIPSVLAGFGMPMLLGAPAHTFLAVDMNAHMEGTHGPVALIATIAAILGIAAGALLYGLSPGLRRSMAAAFSGVVGIVRNKFYVDELYQAVFVRGTMALSSLAGFLDRYLVDGIVNGLAGLAVAVGAQTRRLTTGMVQGYMTALFAGVVLAILIFQLVGGGSR